MEIFGFVMFAGDTETQHWTKMGLTQVFRPSGNISAFKCEI